MLDHLDDPTPFQPGDEFRGAVQARAARLRRRRRVAISGAAAVLVVGLLSATGLYVARRDAAIDRVEVTSQPSTDGAVNVLVVGTDGRPGFEGVRADTMILVRFRPDGTVGLLPISRDLASSSGDRLAAAYRDGPDGLVDAVTATLGLPIDHVAVLDFAGFADIVDELGGLEVRTETPLRDEGVGLDITAPGCHTLDGSTALALVRARHVFYVTGDSTRVTDPTGDLGRMARAQTIVGIAIRELATGGAEPAHLDRLSRVLADHATLDDGLTLGVLVDLARRLASAGSEHTTEDALPLAMATRGDGSVVTALAAGAGEVLHRYGASNPPTSVETSSTDIAPVLDDGILPISPC